MATDQINLGNVTPEQWQSIKKMLEESFASKTFVLFASALVTNQKGENSLNHYFHVGDGFLFNDFEIAQNEFKRHCEINKAEKAESQPVQNYVKVAEPIIKDAEFTEEKLETVKMGQNEAEMPLGAKKIEESGDII